MTQSSVEPPQGAILTRDLMFGPKVTSTARDLGKRVVQVSSAEKLSSLAAEHPLRCVILDLATPTADLVALVATLQEQKIPHIIAFDAHVRGDSLRAARDAGCHQVLPRSRFAGDLVENLGRWL